MQDLTTGSITRHLVTTTAFMLVMMVFQTLYFLIDLYWVGRLGKEAVAAVGIGGNLTFIVLAISQMLGVGTTALVSHATGRADRDRAVMLFNQSQVLSMLSGAVFLALGLALRVPYSRALAADAGTAALGAEYLLWFIPAMALQFAMVAMGAALRGTGNFKPGMVVGTATVILNMLIAPVLIFGWGTGRAFGVGGAAMSSLVAVAVGVAWLAGYFVGPGAYLHFRRADLRPRFSVWTGMLRIGLPAGAEFALTALYLLVVYSVARPFGASAQAGVGIGLRLVQALFLPVVALGFSVAPVAGQNVGARKADRVRGVFRSAAGMAAGLMLAASLLCNLAAEQMFSVFTSDRGVIRVGVDYLRIASWSFVGSGIVFVSSSMFQALGNTIPPLMTSFARNVLVIIPVVALAQLPGFQLTTIWYLSAVGILLQMGINLLLLDRELRLKLPLARADQPSVSA